MDNSQPSLFKKIHAIQVECQKVNKGGTNNFNKYSYARLGDVLEAIRPHLKTHGLVIHQSHEVKKCHAKELNGSLYSIAVVECITTITDISNNECERICTPGMAWDKNGDKAIYKAITGSRKYGITSLFCLDWDAIDPEDDDDDDEPVTRRPRNTSKGKVF